MFDRLKSDKYKIKKKPQSTIYSATSFNNSLLAWYDPKKAAYCLL